MDDALGEIKLTQFLRMFSAVETLKQKAHYSTCYQKLTWDEEQICVFTCHISEKHVPGKVLFCLIVTCSWHKKTPRSCNYVTEPTKQPKSNALTRRVQEETRRQQIASQCNLTQPKTTQPPSNSISPDCQGHFVMLCVNAARHDCPSSLHFSRLLSLSVLWIWVAVGYSKKH